MKKPQQEEDICQDCVAASFIYMIKLYIEVHQYDRPSAHIRREPTSPKLTHQPATYTYMVLMHKTDMYNILMATFSALSFYLKLLMTTFLAIFNVIRILACNKCPDVFSLAGRCYICDGIIALGQIYPVVLCV